MDRQQILENLKGETQTFDVVVVGGGITGAGVAREAAGSGLKTLLVEQKDFAWGGTSSRSSKMVHGGLRYLASGHIGLTRDAVRERERMLLEAPGLVDPLPFLMPPHYKGSFPGPPGLFQMLLAMYDRLAGTRSHQKYTPAETLNWAPPGARYCQPARHESFYRCGDRRCPPGPKADCRSLPRRRHVPELRRRDRRRPG